jgi:hypothetical protein
MKTLQELAQIADDFADQLSPGEFHPGWHDVRDAKFAELIVNQLFSKVQIDGSDFWYNDTNQYGTVKATFFTDTDPWYSYRGTEATAEYQSGVIKGTGRYYLNSEFSNMVLAKCGLK